MSADLSIDPAPAENELSVHASDSRSLETQWKSESNASTDRLTKSRWSRWPRQCFRMVVRSVTAPVRAYLSLRRSMTVASVSVLLASFMTLNVIWGFPWSGMMGGCFALLVVGFTISRVMRPILKLSVSLPRSAVAGNPFSVSVRLKNSRSVPAMNLRVGWHREGVRDIFRRDIQRQWDASSSVSVDLLRGGEQMQWHGAMCFDRRGIHALPPFQVASTYPFHLFHYRKPVGTRTKIAITPAPLGVDDDPATRILLTAVGDWAKQLVAGAPVEYIGNREYQEGVAVRRWDFASWARLGRPIVREYQSPSIQAVSMIVDTSRPETESSARSNMKRERLQADELFERLMSICATAIADITSRRVHLQLYLTSESNADLPGYKSAIQAGEGNELMLVRLAGATPMDPELAESRIRDAIESSHSRPILLFSLLELDHEQREALRSDLPPNVTYLPVKPTHRDGDSTSQ